MPDRRGNAGRTAILVFGVVLAAAGCAGEAVGGSPEPETSPKERVTVDPTPATHTTALECGQPFTSSAGGGLTLTGRFPATVPAGERAVTGTVEITSRAAVRGVLTPRADVFLVRDGRIATVPVAQDASGVEWDLAPGKVESMPGDVALVSCGPDGGSVRPGTYELYARVVMTSDDGASVESFGGPWPLDVR